MIIYSNQMLVDERGGAMIEGGKEQEELRSYRYLLSINGIIHKEDLFSIETKGSRIRR